jgi:hypothetical protein
MAGASERTARGFLVVSVLFLLTFVMGPCAAVAQVAPRYEVFGGYSYLRFDSPTIGYSDYSNLNGWNAGATFNLKPQWGIAVDASGHYGSQLASYHYYFGPQYSWRRDKSKVFFHALFGKTENVVDILVPPRSSVKGVGRSIGGGGGFDWDFRPRITIRVVQVDYFNSTSFGATQNDVRVSGGVVFNIGHIGHHPKL